MAKKTKTAPKKKPAPTPGGQEREGELLDDHLDRVSGGTAARKATGNKHEAGGENIK